MKGWAMGAVLAAILAACGEPEVCQRYRLERELWKTTREAQRLSIRPDFTTLSQWHSVAVRYESIAAPQIALPPCSQSTPSGQVGCEVRKLMAQALLAAAQIRRTIGDSAQAMALYERIPALGVTPQIAAEAELAHGRLAESWKNWSEAIKSYSRVVESLEPRTEELGPESEVIDLPLRIARLRVLESGDSSAAARAAFYGEARRYYSRLLAQNPGTMIGLKARARTAELAMDLKDWSECLSQLRRLEQENLEFRPPPQDPGEIRYTIALAQTYAGQSLEMVTATLNSILQEYPRSSFAPRALLAMALNTGRSGNVDGALNLIARLDRDYPEAEDVRSEAMLTQGKFLADSGRWGKAQEVFRALPFQHPMTEAALQTPLEVAKHYALAGDSASHVKALREAESIYLEFITRYPGGQLTTSAREKLASVLASQSRYSEAITELTRLGESLSRTPGGAAFFLRAAQMAWRDLGDTARAAEILKRTGEIYAGTEVGRQTKEMAAELRRSEGSLVRP